MSPARSRRTPIPHRRSRDEILRAVGVAAAIVILTAALVWLLRPGPAGSLGGGGLMSRQPRASGLVAGALVVAGLVTWWILRVSRRARGHEKVVLPIALALVLVAAIVVGIAWPGGLLRQYPSLPKPITPTTTLPPSSTGPTGATGTTGATSSSTTPTTGVSTTASP